MTNLCIIVCDCASCNKEGCLTCFDFKNFVLRSNPGTVTSASTEYVIVNNKDYE